MASQAEILRRRAADEARIEAAKKAGLPTGGVGANYAIDRKSYDAIQRGEKTWDDAYKGMDLANARFQSTGTSGGLVNPAASGGGGGGGYGGGGGGRDPMAQAALERIQRIGTGADVPFNPAQTDRMMSAQSDMNAAAEAQRQAALRRTVAAGGGSLYDPSTGAAEREITSQRQDANTMARRDIDTNAQQANFEAQFAANRLLAAQRADGGGGGGSSPFGPGGRYGYGDGGMAAYDDTDPRRGGNIRSYNGPLSLDPRNLNYAGGSQQAADRGFQQPGSGYTNYTKKPQAPARQQFGAR